MRISFKCCFSSCYVTLHYHPRNGYLWLFLEICIQASNELRFEYAQNDNLTTRLAVLYFNRIDFEMVSHNMRYFWAVLKWSEKNQLDLVFSPKNWQLSPNTTFFLHTFFILNVSILLTNDRNLEKNGYYMHIMEPNVPFNLIFLWKFINMLQKKNLQAKAIDQRLRSFKRCSFRKA